MSVQQDQALAADAAADADAEGAAPATHSGRLLVRMPGTLHAELAREADREGVSLNAFIVAALSGAVAWRSNPAARAAGANTPAAAAGGPTTTPAAAIPGAAAGGHGTAPAGMTTPAAAADGPPTATAAGLH